MRILTEHQPVQATIGGRSTSRYLSKVVLGVTILFLLGANVHMNLQLDRVRAEASRFRNSMQSDIEGLRDAAAASASTGKRDLEILRNELERARRQANLALIQTRKVILAHAEELTRKLAEEQRKRQQEVASELIDVKRVAIRADAKISNVSGEVLNVKSVVDSAKSELEKTVSDLRRVNDDVGAHSRLIATNAGELEILKQLGDRNYFEFNIGNTKQPHRVADIALLLKKSDPAKNQYTVEVLAEDKKTEKKDKTVNEPVQFYVSRVRQPYELVVNEVRKNQIVGYLATPKTRSERIER